jgi:FkbM family methyltransferase
MKGLFIDAGANIGQAFLHFQNLYPLDRFDFWLIEPNPHCIPILNQYVREGVKLFERALWDQHTHLNLYCTSERGATDPGRSVETCHNSLYYISNPQESVKVETVACDSLISYATGRYSPIVCKLDIESAEYRVLESWIRSGLIKSIDKLYVEFHTQYMKMEDRNHYLPREQRIKSQLADFNVDWAAWG